MNLSDAFYADLSPTEKRRVRQAKKEGRLNGRWKCSVCGMRQHEYFKAKLCCGGAGMHAYWLREPELETMSSFRTMQLDIRGSRGHRLPGC